MLYRTTKGVPSLAREHFFADISEEVVARLDAFAYHRHYEPRQIIYFPDDVCDYVYWVRAGRVKITRVSGAGREVAFRHLRQGDMFGEEGLADAERRNNYAEATAPALLTLIRSEDFARIIRENAALSHAVARHLCRRLVEMESILSEYVFAKAHQRVACHLWRLYQHERKTGPVSLQVTHQDIANLTGTARETVTNVLHELRDEGVIGLANCRIEIRAPDALQSLSVIE